MDSTDEKQPSMTSPAADSLSEVSVSSSHSATDPVSSLAKAATSIEVPAVETAASDPTEGADTACRAPAGALALTDCGEAGSAGAQQCSTPISRAQQAPALTISKSNPTLSHSLRHEIRVWTRDLLIAIGLALVIIVFLYQPVKVEGTSMAPLLSDQERIFINKFVYRFEPIERGDVVVFWYPLDRSKSFIKRVIGLPGEMVEIRQGILYVNAKVVREPYVPPQYEDMSDFGPVRVPKDSYFVMGDHRISSNDSRVFGPVASKYIYGRAVFAYWPVEHFGSLGAAEAGAR